MINSKSYYVLNDNDELKEQPYEKCLLCGAEALSDAQLLAAILRTGTNGVSATELSAKILALSVKNSVQKNSSDDMLTGLLKLSIPELMSVKGIGEVKAVQIKCICELSRRIAKQSAKERLDFSEAESVAGYYMEDMRHLDREQLVLVMLDSKCRLIKDMVLSVGTVNASIVNTRDVFAEALRYNAVSIIMLHNHPSGDCTPSRNDLLVTGRIQQAGDIMGIKLIDHIIIGDNTYTSLREKEYIR